MCKIFLKNIDNWGFPNCDVFGRKPKNLNWLYFQNLLCKFVVVLVHFYQYNEHHHLKELKNLDQDFFIFNCFKNSM